MPIDIGGGSLFWTSGIRTSGLRRDSKVIQGEFAKLGASGGKLGRLLSPKVLGIAGLVIGLEQIGEAAFKFSKEFESAFAQVKTISAQTVDGFADMERGILELTTQIPVGATESAEALYQIVSAGIDGADAMHLLEVASKAAVGGVTEVETAADGLTTIINAFSLAASDAEEIAAALFTTVKLGKTTFGELSSSIAQAASIAANSGIEYQELLAAITTLTKSGVPTAQAVTQVRSAILAVTEVLGDGAFAGRTMQEAFILVREASKGSNTELRVMLGRVEALNAVLGLTGAKAKSAADDLNAIKTETENANDAFAVMVATTDNQFKLLGNNIKQKFLKPVGDGIIEVARDVAKRINEIFETSEKRITFSAREILRKAGVKISEAQTKKETFDITADQSRILFRQQDALNNRIKELRALRNDLLLGVEKVTKFIAKPLESVISGVFGNELSSLTPQTDLLKHINSLIEQRDAVDKARRILDEQLNRLGSTPDLDFTELLAADVEGAEIDLQKVIGKLTKAIRTSGIEKDVKEALEERLKEATGNLDVFSDKSIKALKKKLKDAFELKDEPLILEIKADLVDAEKTAAIFKDKIERAFDPIEVPLKILTFGDDIIKQKEDDPLKNIIFNQLALGKLKEGLQFIENTKKEWVLINGELVKFDKKITVQPSKIKKLDKEGKKFKKTIDDQVEGITKEQEATNKLSNDLSEASQSMNDLAIFAAEFDGELANAIQSLAGIAAGLGTIISSGGNPFAIIAGGLQILTGVISGLFSGESESVKNARILVSVFEQQNRELERQRRLRISLSGVDVTQSFQESLDLINSQLVLIDSQAFNILRNIFGSNAFGNFDDNPLSDLEEFLNNPEILAAWSEQGYNEEIEAGNALIDNRIALLETELELRQELVQTSTEEVANLLLQGFEEGKTSIEDFADTFEELMKNAILQSFKTRFLLAASEDFFKEFTELAKGGLTADEIEELQESLTSVIDGATSEFEAINQIFNDVFGTDLFGDVTGQADSLAGQIGRAITEDSATLFIGLLTRTGFDTREQVVLQINMVELQTDIAANTLRTAIACESLDSKISESNQTDRDSGLNLG